MIEQLTQVKHVGKPLPEGMLDDFLKTCGTTQSGAVPGWGLEAVRWFAEAAMRFALTSVYSDEYHFRLGFRKGAKHALDYQDMGQMDTGNGTAEDRAWKDIDS